jgi:hypothetical protein
LCYDIFLGFPQGDYVVSKVWNVDVIFGVLTVVSISIKAFLDATPCSLVDKVTKLWEEPATTIIHPENGTTYSSSRFVSFQQTARPHVQISRVLVTDL